MGVFEIIGGIFLVLICAGIIIAVAMQESPKGTGVGALTGGDTFYDKNKGRTFDFMLIRITRILGIAFGVIAVIVYAVDVYVK